MASVISLGVHEPVGLQHAVEQEILPPNAPASAYTWDIITTTEDGVEYEDELLATPSCVIWSRGGLFRKSFRFDVDKEPVTQALLAYFPTSADGWRSSRTPSSLSAPQPTKSTSPAEKTTLARALVVFLRSQAHIYFLSGTSHVVHMPFEVESACAAPVGVIIQRKIRADGVTVPLRLPKVPPASFLSSQLPAPRRSHGHSLTEFSTEGLGNPKILPLRLSLTLENMPQTHLEATESNWPRLVCLTDPLLELGLVVTRSETRGTVTAQRGSSGSPFLARSEEILHIETIAIPRVHPASPAQLTVAVTVNRETNMYTVWRLSYLDNDDPFLGTQKKRKPKPSRRRSSMAPGLASGGTTPVHSSTRESFGPLPGKKTRKSVKIDKGAKAEDEKRALEKALSSLVDVEKGNERRQSRRVSSLLARADLSASQDRAAFAEQSMHGGQGGRRAESHGSNRLRLSSGYGGPSFGATFNYNRISNLPENPPVDNLLEELRAGGDFEGFHNMGLDDRDFDGLQHEMLFTKIQSVTMDAANLRYSMSSKPARTQAKVFILCGPPTATDSQGRSLLLISIQDPVDKRLQLLTLHVEPLSDQTPAQGNAKQALCHPDLSITAGEPRRVQSVVDSCKVSDGNEAIMVLSEDSTGGRELSLQSPWGKVTTLALPSLFLSNPGSLEFTGNYLDQAMLGGPPPTVNISGTQIDAICHTNSRGLVHLRDREGRCHRIRIQLQPRCPQVRRILDVCRSVLHASHADKIVAGWWHVMQWLRDTARFSLQHPPANTEWSAAVILLISSFLALGHSSETSLRALGGEVPKPFVRGTWDAMMLREAPNSQCFPSWMLSKAWRHLLDGPYDGCANANADLWLSGGFIASHVALAKRWMASASGLAAFGFEGYLPTALNRSGEPRNMAAWSMLLALHLLVEEEKLDITCPGDASPGPTDLKALLYQLVKWLKWPRYEAVYSLEAPVEPPVAQKLAPFPIVDLPEPSSEYCVLSWIHGHLTSRRGTEYPTLSDLYSNATRDPLGGRLRGSLWTSLTPRTLMFSKLFGSLSSVTNRFDAVVALHECGFSPRVLETLPESILAPLQDLVSICQPDPPPSWSKDLLALVGRPDVSGALRPDKTWHVLGANNIKVPSHKARWDVRMLCQDVDWVDNLVEDAGAADRQAVVQSLFREDRRLVEAHNLLSTTRPRVVRLDPKQEWTEAEYLEKQKELVATVATSTLAIPSGRGLLYFGLRYPILTQKYHVSGFNLACIVKPVNNTVSVDKSMFSEEKINWAFFHLGVAGGLAISPQAKGIDTSWILYNKPGQDLSNRHAGFLLALGLNGHLKSVARWVAFKYLTPKHTMTTIGLLLGLAASHIGTMDALMTRLLSVHVTRMLPRGAADLNLSTATQTSGLMGIGLVFCNSQQRRMSEIMLSEIEHLGSEVEEEGAVRDESYRLAAGFALGLINLGKGGDLRGLRDMQLTEKLLTLATATKRVELVNVLDWSAAGAVVAIALIYLKSEDHIVARKVDVPDSLLQFDYVRPDILLLRTVAKHLILWSGIDPTFDWIINGLPPEYRQRYQLTDVTKLQSRDLPFFSILAGLCFALGLRFAGSANVRVRDLLVHYLDQFSRIVRIAVGNYDGELARNNACMCMDVLALSSAMVMAGTGDIIVLRRLRAFHGRNDPNTSYGSHLAAHLAIGALFLGSGTATFGTNDLAVASLLVAFYPLFPATVQDNRSHLQAFRHFWVLATQPRCIVTKDLITDKPLNVPILIHLKPGSQSAAAASQSAAEPTDPNGTTIRRQTPCLLPPLDDIARVETDARSLGYWDLTLDFAQSPRIKDDFRTNQTVYLRRRPADEDTFPATLRALATRPSSTDTVLVASNKEENDHSECEAPLDWVLDLPSLSGILSQAEREMVLDPFSVASGVSEGKGANTAVDARLALRAGLDGTSGLSRDRLLGLKLLFEWADTRGMFARGDSALDKTEESAAAGAGGKARRGKEKGKKAATTRGKKKVSLEAAQAQKEHKDGDAGKAKGPWWLADNAIDELKGLLWLANHEG
ncbi:hypothetical protein VTJ83DRAFT_6175 [Remersonia thermophila]|uniref:Anaphase-promoting complex subunit 1 N-terminal domain-containing protein n=1 Tax=Remersonia thermophila TaxID=72144 RepID=A0ABR4D907_9PEZI